MVLAAINLPQTQRSPELMVKGMMAIATIANDAANATELGELGACAGRTNDAANATELGELGACTDTSQTSSN